MLKPLNPRTAAPSVGETPEDTARRCTQTTPAEPSGRTPSPAPAPPIKIAAHPATAPAPALTRTLTWLLLGAAGMATLLSLLSPAGHDQLWFLLMAARWRHGAALYGPALFDSNPPLVVWLSAIPDTLASASHTAAAFLLSGNTPSMLQPLFTPTLWAKLLVIALLALVAALSLALLHRLAPPLNATARRWLLLAFLVLAAVIPARDFGQRDHLAGLLCLPYILAAATRLRGQGPALTHSRTLRLAAVLLAALGLALKPQQALIAIAVELTLLLLWLLSLRAASPAGPAPPHRRLAVSSTPLLHLEPATFLLAGLAYLLLIHRFAPNYVTVALPLLRQTYWAIAHLNTLALIGQAPQLYLLALTTLTIFLWQRSRPTPPTRPAQPAQPLPHGPTSTPPRIPPIPTLHDDLRPAILLLLAAGAGATLAYHLQATGWYYQQLPALTCFSAALALSLLEPLSRITAPPRALSPLAAILTTVALVLTAFFLRDTLLPGHSTFTSPDPALFAAIAPGTPVAILTTSVEDSMMPVAQHHLLWAQRTNNLWLLPALLRLEDPHPTPLARAHTLTPAQLAALDAHQHRAMVEDLTRWQPTLILIERCQDPTVHCQELEDRHDDLLAWLLRDPAFRTLWQHYHPGPAAGPYDTWLLR